MGVFLLFVGMAVNTLAGLVIIVRAFKVSVGWGLAVMFLPFAGLFFIIKNWEDTKTPFLVGLGGGVLMLIGVFASVPDASDATSTVASQSEEPRASYASAAATPTSYEPPRTTYEPSSSTSSAQTSTYTPSYAPPPAPVPAALTAAATGTQPVEDEWQRKPKFEQVYVDRDTFLFYAEKCKKKPENVYRVPRTVAIAQGLTEAKCR